MVEIAKILVRKTTGHCLLRRQIPARAKKAVCVSVEFDDPVWNGLVKTVVFRGNGKKIAEFDGEIAIVPWEVLENPGPQLWFGIWGSDPETGLQLPLIEVRIGPIEESTDPEADPGTDPTLPIWAQLKQDVEELKKGGIGSGGDWNANEGEPGHILNRTHWTEGGAVIEILPETTLVANDEGAMYVFDAVPTLTLGDSYTVVWNSAAYNCVAQEYSEEDMTGVVLGNLGAVLGGTDTGEPFVILTPSPEAIAEGAPYLMIALLDGSTEATIAIYGGDGEVVHKLDNKYLDLEWLPIIGKKEILPFQTVETTDTTDQKNYFVYVPYSNGAEIYNGLEITAEVNGVPYKCVVAGDTMDGFLAIAGGVRLAFYTTNILVMTTGSRSLTLRVYIPKPNKIPEVFMPEGIGEVDPTALKEAVQEYLEENPPSGVQFETDESLKLENGVLSVNTTDQVQEDNHRPITSQAVHEQFETIVALLKTI